MLPQWIDMPEDVDEEMTRFLVEWGEKHRAQTVAKNARRRARYAENKAHQEHQERNGNRGLTDDSAREDHKHKE